MFAHPILFPSGCSEGREFQSRKLIRCDISSVVAKRAIVRGRYEALSPDAANSSADPLQPPSPPAGAAATPVAVPVASAAASVTSIGGGVGQPSAIVGGPTSPGGST